MGFVARYLAASGGFATPYLHRQVEPTSKFLRVYP